MKKILGIVMLIICLAVSPSAAYAGGVLSAPSVTVSLKEPETMKHRTISSDVSLRIRAKRGEKEVKWKKLSFQSSDPSVATVNRKGIVRTRKEGELCILVSSRDGEGKAVLRLSVKENLYKSPALEILDLTGTTGELSANL